jgi:F420 biosynthesis protein FbiB-like protein
MPFPGEGSDFWENIDRLVASREVVIDRPRNSRHPRYEDLIYPLDYGYLEGTSAMDGDEIDVWVGSLPSRIVDAVILTVDLKKHDAEMKILIGCTEEEKSLAYQFLNDGWMRAMLVRREAGGLRWLRERRSVRRFLPTPISNGTLDRLLEAAGWAPSSHNRQPWRFAVLATPESRTRLADRMGADFRRDLLADGLATAEVETQVQRSRSRILEAPAAVLICLDPTTGDQYPDEERRQAEYLMGVQSVAMAGQNLLLAAHAEGLAGVWVCAPLFTPGTVREALELPENWHPQGLILLGYPAKIPTPRPRHRIEDIARYL